jgi:hypothetical protein
MSPALHQVLHHVSNANCVLVVNLLPEQAESLAFSAKAVESQEKHKQLLQTLEQKKRARYVVQSGRQT